MRKWGFSGLMTAAFAVLCGCGGSSGGGAADQTLQLGQLRASYSGSAKTFVATGSGSVTVTGASGASYSKVTLSPSADIANTSILYTSDGLVYSVTPGGVVTQIPLPGLNVFSAVYTNDGHVAFVAQDESGNSSIFECNYDGSNQVLLISDVGDAPIGWAPNNAKVAYANNTGELVVSNPNGSSPVVLNVNGYFDWPSFSPDSTQIVYTQFSGTDSNLGVFTVPVSGGTSSLVPNQDLTDNNREPSWVGSNEVAFTVDSGSFRFITAYFTNGLEGFFVEGDGSIADDEQPTISPDGKTLAYLQAAKYNTNPYELVESGENGNYVTNITAAPLEGIRQPTWSPFQAPQTFVGSSGSLMANAAGFLWGQNGDSFASMVTFTSSTPDTTTVTSQNSSGGTLVFDIHATSLTGLKYRNGYYNAIQTISTTGATDAYVSFDATTGLVDTVAPFIANARTAKPTSQGVYQAQFLGVWNSKGKNVAPNGASQIVIDSAGRLASFQ